MIFKSADASPESPKPARIPFDSAFWQMRDAGDFIHTKTGEVRDEGGFLSEADAPDSDSNPETWGGLEDAGWDDETGGFSGGAFTDEGGSRGFDNSVAQVRNSRSDLADKSDDRPSKLSPRKTER